MRLGLHLSVAGGLAGAARQGARLGLECLQVFCTSPRVWRQRRLGDGEAAEFRALCRAAGLEPVVVHAPYLINLASGDDELWQRSVDALAEQLARAERIGARAVVVHPGSPGARGLQWGLERTARALERVWRMDRGAARVWLENTSGGGASLGATLSQLAWWQDRLAGDRLGFCLDTAHAFAAGYRLHQPQGAARFLTRAEELVGLEAVGLWHLNDTVHPRGSRRDHLLN